MIAYHGSVVKNLKELKPFTNPYSNLKYPCVYLTTNQALASIYIWNHPFKWMTFEIGKDGTPIYNESFKNGLFEFYNGVQGCIYVCDSDFYFDSTIGIKSAVICKEPVKVSHVIPIENVYEYILHCEKDGTLIINHYENLSAEQKQKDRNMVLGAIKRLELLKGEHPLSIFVAQKFPELWEEASHLQKFL